MAYDLTKPPTLSGLLSIGKYKADALPASVGPTPTSTTGILEALLDPEQVTCLLEVTDADGKSNPIYHPFPVSPESLMQAQRYLQAITPTLGGVFVDDYGEAPAPIMLQGTFGRSKKSLTSLTTGQPLGSYTGYQFTKLLSELVRLSHTPDKDKKPRVVKFYNFAFDAYFEVTLDAFDASMSVQQNNLWVYSLQMTVLRPFVGRATDTTDIQKDLRRRLKAAGAAAAKSASPNSLGAKLLAFGKKVKAAVSAQDGTDRTLSKNMTNVMGMLANLDKVSKASRFITRLSPGDLIGYGSNYLDNKFKWPPGTFGQIVGYATEMPNYLAAAMNVVNQTTARLPNDVRREIQQARDVVETAIQSIEGGAKTSAFATPDLPVLSLRATPLTQAVPNDSNPLPQVDAGVVELSEMLLNMQHTLDTIDVVLGMQGVSIDSPAVQESTSVVATAVNGTMVGGLGPTSDLRTYVVRQNDTLSRIAQTIYGDAEQWPRIVDANQTLLGSLTGGISADEYLDFFLGQTLIVPVAALTDVTFDPAVLDAPVGASALGVDWSTELTTITRVDDDATTTEIAVLSPGETLLQGIDTRLMTPLGALVDAPDYGSRMPLLVGEDFGVLNDAMARARITEALSNEPRLETVRNVTLAHARDAVTITFDATTIRAGTLGLVTTTISRNLD